MRALLLSLVLLTGCTKGDRDECEKVCRHSYELRYWRDADKSIAAAPEKDRAALRKRMLGMYDSRLEDGVELCISQCVSANNDTMNKCLLDSKTGSDVDACVKD